MKKLICFVFFFAAPSFIFPQTIAHSTNIIYAELLGNGLLSSLNYERVISNDFSVRFGVGFSFDNSESNSGGHHTTAFFPLAMANYLIDLYGNNYLEIGGGVLVSSTNFSISTDNYPQSESVVVPTTAVGYRYSPKDGGIFFSAAFDTFIFSGIAPWAGIGIGYRF